MTGNRTGIPDENLWQEHPFTEPASYPSDALAEAKQLREELEQVKAERDALREALREIVMHCGNEGYGNPVVNERIVDRCEGTALETLSALDALQEQEGG